MQMTPRERMLAALERRPVDRIPVLDWLDQKPCRGVVDLLGLEVPERETGRWRWALVCTVVEALEMDAVQACIGVGVEPAGEDRVRDRFGCLYAPSEHGESFPLAGPIGAPADLSGFDMAARIEDRDFDEIRYKSEAMGAERPPYVVISDPFKWSWLIRGGMQHLLMDYIRAPELVHGIARVATDYCLALVERIAALGIEFMMLDGDLASEQNLLMSKRHFDAYVGPYEREVVERAHALGLKIIKHTDGAAWPLMEEFVELGFDAFNPIQPDCMDLAETKRVFGDRIALVGNIDCRGLLSDESPEAVERAVEETIRIAAPGGGYILSSSNSIHSGVRPENFVAMVRAAHRYGGGEQAARS